jgi:hypothetical protein
MIFKNFTRKNGFLLQISAGLCQTFSPKVDEKVAENSDHSIDTKDRWYNKKIFSPKSLAFFLQIVLCRLRKNIVTLFFFQEIRHLFAEKRTKSL